MEDNFLNNECMCAIKELVKNNPNDADLGAAVRAFLIGLDKINKGGNNGK